MAKPKLVAATAEAEAPEWSDARIKMEMAALACQATYEIEALAAELARPGLDQRADTFVYLARGIGRRIDALNSIIMLAVHDSKMRADDVRGCERDLYG